MLVTDLQTEDMISIPMHLSMYSQFEIKQKHQPEPNITDIKLKSSNQHNSIKHQGLAEVRNDVPTSPG